MPAFGEPCTNVFPELDMTPSSAAAAGGGTQNFIPYIPLPNNPQDLAMPGDMLLGGGFRMPTLVYPPLSASSADPTAPGVPPPGHPHPSFLSSVVGPFHAGAPVPKQMMPPIMSHFVGSLPNHAFQAGMFDAAQMQQLTGLQASLAGQGAKVGRGAPERLNAGVQEPVDLAKERKLERRRRQNRESQKRFREKRKLAAAAAKSEQSKEGAVGGGGGDSKP
jgi:hypothetical protein